MVKTHPYQAYITTGEDGIRRYAHSCPRLDYVDEEDLKTYRTLLGKIPGFDTNFPFYLFKPESSITQCCGSTVVRDQAQYNTNYHKGIMLSFSEIKGVPPLTVCSKGKLKEKGVKFEDHSFTTEDGETLYYTIAIQEPGTEYDPEDYNEDDDDDF